MSTAVASSPPWNARYSGKVPHTTSYYTTCMVGGALACGLTHTAVTPLDVVKCNMQVDPAKYKNLMGGFRTVVAEDGAGALVKGITPTFIGYHMQGMFKFGLNEIFKDQYANLVGQENALKYRALVWASASASAEFFADIALCPMEMVKVKVQTAARGTFPTAFAPAVTHMWSNRASMSYPFGSLVPLWSRQIPYTVVKFVGFEFTVENFYRYIFTNPKDSYSKATQLGVTFASGYIAGVFSAVVSQPADNLVSQMGKPENKGKSFGQMAKEQGVRNLFMRGLGTTGGEAAQKK